MKPAKIISFTLLLACLCLPLRSKAQTEEIQQLLLNVEKLNQLKNILTDMKKGYDIISKGYGTLKSISEGSFNLHQTYLDGLYAVNPTIRNYKRVADIIAYQKLIAQEYKKNYNLFRQNGNFSSEELGYLAAVYTNLFQQSLQHLDELVLVLTAGELRMSDDERLAEIDRIYTETEDKFNFIRDFNRQATILAIQRARERHDIRSIEKLYDITP